MNETEKALIIYDNDGRVWGIYAGETEVPSGVQGFIADIPSSGIKDILPSIGLYFVSGNASIVTSTF